MGEVIGCHLYYWSLKELSDSKAVMLKGEEWGNL